jgi:hypothetical protein
LILSLNSQKGLGITLILSYHRIRSGAFFECPFFLQSQGSIHNLFLALVSYFYLSLFTLCHSNLNFYWAGGKSGSLGEAGQLIWGPGSGIGG